MISKNSVKTVTTKTKVNRLISGKINDSVASFIPFKSDGKFGYKNQSGKTVIPPTFSNAGFFTEDCRLENSNNNKIRKFGSKDFASVSENGHDYRINFSGKKVYEFKNQDLGKCSGEFINQKFHSYMKQGYYGIIEDEKFSNPEDYKSFRIYPQYQYLHIMEGDDLRNPMIIAAQNDRFGVIDVNNKTIIPFEYADIKPNFSWKLARLFEVSKDGKNYFYIDVKNHIY